MSGYGNPVIHIPFPEATDDSQEDPVWLAIRNPQYMSPGEMSPEQVVVGPDGKPSDTVASMRAMYKVYANMILGWRVYDPGSIAIDESGTVQPMRLMPSPPTPELVGKLPMFILNKLSEVVKEAINPPSSSEKGGTTKTSSSQPSQSMPVTGQVTPFPVRSAISS